MKIVSLPPMTFEEVLAFLASLEDRVVPPAGIEPAHREVPDFESGASTNSAKGAAETCACRSTEPATGTTSPGTLPHGTTTATRQADCWSILAGVYPELMVSSVVRFADRVACLELDLELPNEWEADFWYDSRGYWYLQIGAEDGKCNVTGEPMSWRGRKWLVSEHMTDGEIVQTVFKAVLTALEHEAREQFKYKGQSIMDPHYDIEKLVALRSRPDALAERVG